MTHTERGHFVWHDHMTRDPRAAIAFYTDVVAWETRPFGDATVMWVGSQGPLGAVTELPEQVARMGVPPHWMGYVQVPDVDAAATLATRLGGKLHHGPKDVAAVGRFAVLTDPQGAAFAVFAPLAPRARHDVEKEGEVCWNELVTSDPAAAAAFYGELLGWKVLEERDMGAMGKYRIYGVGETRLGGMMTSPEPMPPTWLFYLQTPDLDAALARATGRGARVVSGPMGVPGGGRIAQLIDPQGALFALHQSPPS